MNNRGFGLTEMIVFIVVSLVTLVICVIVYDQNFGKTLEVYDNSDDTVQIIGDNKNIDYEEENTNKEEQPKTEKLSKVEKQYKELKDKMISTAKIYVTDNYVGKTDKIIIKLSKLVNDEYMQELIDPNNKDNICTGYVVYDGNDNYDAYLKCEGNYTSENYNVDFE